MDIKDYLPYLSDVSERREGRLTGVHLADLFARLEELNLRVDAVFLSPRRAKDFQEFGSCIALDQSQRGPDQVWGARVILDDRVADSLVMVASLEQKRAVTWSFGGSGS